MTTEMLAVWVNETLGLSEDDQYCADTMRNWLHYCNFNVTETKKCIYFDGHERQDVIKV